MGVEIYIIPRGDEEKYNLGKTRSGFDVALREICTGKRYFTLPPVDELAALFFKCAQENGCWDPRFLNMSYMTAVAEHLSQWAKSRQLRWKFDSSSTYKEDRYPTTRRHEIDWKPEGETS